VTPFERRFNRLKRAWAANDFRTVYYQYRYRFRLPRKPFDEMTVYELEYEDLLWHFTQVEEHGGRVDTPDLSRLEKEAEQEGAATLEELAAKGGLDLDALLSRFSQVREPTEDGTPWPVRTPNSESS
jgi:hypothetical protein